MSADTLNVPPKNRDTEGGLFKWAGNDHDASERRKLYNILFQAKSFRSCIRTLNMIWDRDSLAVALNDTPEAYRIQLLTQLRTRNRRAYEDIASRLSKLREAVYKNKLDLTFLYPRIATKNFMATLPHEAHQCYECKKEFKEFSDIIWSPCNRHVQCTECWRSIIDRAPASPYNPWGCVCGPKLIYGHSN
jgi:hypothetical protein